MQRVAFKMKLYKGCENEYQKRHKEIWQELSDLLYSKGIHDYSIFLDEETGFLFGTLKITDESQLDELSHHPVMKRWWAFMKDLMDTNPDHSPVSIRLKEVFYLA